MKTASVVHFQIKYRMETTSNATIINGIALYVNVMIKEPYGTEATSDFGFGDDTCSLKAQSHYKVAEPFVCCSPIGKN